MVLAEQEDAMALALVRAHVMESSDYCSKVHAYRRRLRRQDLRRIPGSRDRYKWVVTHTRRRAPYSALINHLPCVCKMPDIGVDVTKAERPLEGRGFSVGVLA